jgi:hypothetical protein
MKNSCKWKNDFKKRGEYQNFDDACSLMREPVIKPYIERVIAHSASNSGSCWWGFMIDLVDGAVQITPHGMVHAWVGHYVMPLTSSLPHLKVMFVPFFTYNELVTSRIHPQQHKQTTKITTMMMEPLAPPVVSILWIHATQAAGGLAHMLSEAAGKGFK